MEPQEAHHGGPREHRRQRERPVHDRRCYPGKTSPAPTNRDRAPRRWPRGGRLGYAACLMSAYLDCPACACLIRSGEPSCPFCGASQRPVFVSATRPRLGLVLGLGLASFSCTGGEGDSTTTVVDSQDSQEADAVTYAGPDTWNGDVTTESPPEGTTTTTTTTNNDSSEADAVTYAGPDETTVIGDASIGTTDVTVGSASTTDTGETCVPVTDDASGIGGQCNDDGDCPTPPARTPPPVLGEAGFPHPQGGGERVGQCNDDGDCLAGYTCQPFQGIVLEMSCQVLCEQTCECPAGLVCTPVADKSGAAWNQCM